MAIDLTGRRLGDFETGRELGRGGMGVVYEARQVSLNRRVALKVLASTVGLTPKAVLRFHREAEAAGRLHHTNIVPVYATGEQGGTHFYAMELIEGPSLDQLIRQLRQPAPAARPADPLGATGPYLDAHAITPSGSGSGLLGSSHSSGSAYFDAVAGTLAGVADALGYAHRAGVIHRDIKPSNLLLSAAGRLSVTDFGLARLLEEPGMTITGEMVGTPRYMSPEQITAGRVRVDHRTDIYSLGATLYELLTLRPPFAGDQRDQLLAQIIHKEPVPPRRVNPKVPVDLETICLKALEKDPDRRYQSAGAMADDLRRYVNRFAILARRAGPLTKVRKWVSRNPALSAALAAVLACAGVAGGLAYRGHQTEQRRAEEQARLEAELLDEKRRAALEKAALASRLENFDEARQAIREAEKLGCSAGQVRMLQGQLELCQGREKEAIEHLTQATDLLPESVAGWSMLAVAYARHGLQGESTRALAEATRRPSVTPEDYLFRGYAESILDPDRAVVTLEEAVRRRPSALVRLVRCEADRLTLLAAPEVDRARRAMDEIRGLKRQFPENAMVATISVQVHLSCIQVFEELGRADLRQAACDEGNGDARVLERFPDSTQAVVARWAFLDLTGQPEAGADALRQLADRTNGAGALYYLGGYCYRRGEYAEAVRRLETVRGDMGSDIIRVFAVAELPDGPTRANQLYREIAARELADWQRFNAQLLLRFLGRKGEAVAASAAFLEEPGQFPPVRQEPFRRALEYCAGRRSAADLVASLNGHRGDLTNVHLCIALTALADGDRATARRHCELCVQTRFYEYLPYDLCRMLLARMTQDPAWPSWIAAKK